MSCRGVHFALAESEVSHLRSLKKDRDRLAYLTDTIEETYFGGLPDLKAESDKSWDAMHRSLADGKLSWKGGSYPLNHTVLGGEALYKGSDYIMSLKSQQQVKDIAAALVAITEADFKRRYLAIDARDYGFELSDEDFEYTWTWFQDVRNLYLRAAAESRYVLFAVDQ